MKTLLITVGAAALLAPGLACAQNLTGTWKVDLEIAGTTYHTNCDVKQDGGALSGKCGGSDEAPTPVAMTGTVDGTTAKFAYDITYQGNPMHVAYTGKVESDTAMDGTVDVQIAQGTFKAAKQ
jgi:hypothetical protein